MNVGLGGTGSLSLSQSLLSDAHSLGSALSLSLYVCLYMCLFVSTSLWPTAKRSVVHWSSLGVSAYSACVCMYV